jgi:hypothetical protein
MPTDHRPGSYPADVVALGDYAGWCALARTASIAAFGGSECESSMFNYPIRTGINSGSGGDVQCVARRPDRFHDGFAFSVGISARGLLSAFSKPSTSFSSLFSSGCWLEAGF